VRRHNPLPYFDNVPAEENRPFTDFPSDFSQLPTVSFVVPNLDNDMHDGTIGEGDTWLQDHLGDYVDWAATHNSILIVTFDEGLPNSDNHIATIFAGAHVIAGNNAQAANHYSLLGTVQEMYDLPPIAHTATAAPISGIWLEGEPPSPPPPPASDFDGRIRGRLFQDRNGNGKRNGGDAPLAGVTVFLDANQNDQFDAGETSTASAENGTYAFSGLAEGTHRVAVGLAGVWRTTTPTREVTFGRRHSVKAGAIGLTQNAALSGTLFNDANSDGAKQDPETGLRDWVVYVDLDGNSQRDRGEPKVRSNKNGEWRFASVSPGTYVVRVQPRRKFVPTIPADASRIGTLIGAQTVSDTLFGFLKS
jgi:hypothetical protein